MLAVPLIAVALLARLIDGFNVVELLVGALVLIGLVARRGDFPFTGDPTARATGLIRAITLVVAAIAYGVITLLINRTAAGLPFHGLAALGATLHALVIGAPSESSVIPDRFSEWFPWSLRAIVALGLAWGAVTWFAPWRHRPVEEIDRRDQAKALVETFGEDTLAPFALRRDKALYLYPEGRDTIESTTTLIAYRVVRGVAIVSGDPIGPPAQVAPAIAAFRAMCAERGWQFALIGASDRFLADYRALGLHSFYHGDEAIVATATFSLGGGPMKSVRQAVNRVARNGYTIAVRTAGELALSERDELAALEETALAGDERKGFAMEFDELFRLDGDDAIFVIGRDANETLVGFLEIAVCPASSSLSLSSMPRSANSPNGLNAALIVAAINWAVEHHYCALSLNFSPAARLLDPSAAPRGWHRLARHVLLVLKRVLGLQLDNLLMFNRHFAPRWQPRYLVIDRRSHFPRVLVAAMAAERYLPFADVLRGRDWHIAPQDDHVRREPVRH